MPICDVTLNLPLSSAIFGARPCAGFLGTRARTVGGSTAM